MTMQKQLEKLLHKRCPWHINAKHVANECFNLQKTFHTPPLDKDKRKGKDNEDKENKRTRTSRRDSRRAIGTHPGYSTSSSAETPASSPGRPRSSHSMRSWPSS